MDLEHPDITRIRQKGDPNVKPIRQPINNENAIEWDPIEWIKEMETKQNKTPAATDVSNRISSNIKYLYCITDQ